jgi:uncharacterized coiled-coil protein SlyX
MTGGDREGLIARVRRIATVRDRPNDEAGPNGEAEDSQNERLRSLEARVAHIERLLEGLQDSVHRESERHANLIAELQAQVQPAAMSASLADDARNRGL